jgi:hypothetical protein
MKTKYKILWLVVTPFIFVTAVLNSTLLSIYLVSLFIIAIVYNGIIKPY